MTNERFRAAFTPMVSGLNVFTITYEDTPGNMLVITRAVLMTTTQPALVSVEPTGVTPNPRPTLRGTFNQPVDPRSVSVTVAGRPIPGVVAQAMSFEAAPAFDVARGNEVPVTVTVLFAGLDGALRSASWSFRVDTEAGVVIDQPAPGSLLGNNTFEVSGRADAGALVTIAALDANGNEMDESRVNATASAEGRFGGTLRVSNWQAARAIRA